VILSGVSEKLAQDFARNGLFTVIDEAFVLPDIQQAIEKAAAAISS